MKKLLLSTILGGALLPCGLLQAQEAQAASRTYGGFAPGMTFKLKVTDKTTVRTRGISVKENVPVPSSMPDFDVGERVKFKIGSRGQLTGSGFSIQYDGREGRLVFYENEPSRDRPRGAAATVTKKSNGKPDKATLTFYRFRFEGFIPVTTTVHYELD